MEDCKNILITGATRGIGRAMATRFSELGHSIAVCGRNQDALSRLESEWVGAVHLAAVDVADADQVARWAESLSAAAWVPELLINNAGVINRQSPLWQLEPDEFRRVIDINVVGIFNVLRAFLPAMIDEGRGVVVNMSSGWGHSTAPLVAPYCASKFAVEGLTRALAQELPDGFAAVPLSPGVIHTEMLETAFGEEASAHWKPEEWVDAAVTHLLQLGPKDNGQSQRISGS